MKKVRVLLAFFPALLAFFACDLHIPKKIEVQAAPDISLKMDIDLGQEIKDKLRENLAGRDVAFAKDYGENDEENMALALRMTVFEMGEQELCDAVNRVSVTVIIGNTTTTNTIANWVDQYTNYQKVTPSNIDEIINSQNSTMQAVLNVNLNANVELPSAIPPINEEIEGMDEIIKDFKLVDNSGELFIYDEKPGSTFSNTLGYKYRVNNETMMHDGVMKPIPSRYNTLNWDADEIDYYPEYEGEDIYPLFVNNAMSAQFSVFLRNNTTVSNLLKCAQGANVKVEIIAWIPLKFEAERNGASFEIPVGLGSGDLFQREKGKKDGLVVKEMNITILFSKEPFNKTFKNKEMQITNGAPGGSFTSTYTLKNDYVEIKFNKAQMNLINGNPANNPFTPLINIIFQETDELVIPWELKTAQVGFYADLAVVVDL
jgi:hypothetical protein